MLKSFYRVSSEREEEMLDMSRRTDALNAWDRFGGYLLPIAFLVIVGIAMIGWLAAIGWTCWHVVTWLLF
jgi:hypothetical protein